MTTISFILVNAAVPANIGASARALKTMGYHELRLVNPCDHLCMEARMLAHASNEILENAKVFPDLEEATKDLDFIIGTTSRKRTVKNKFVHVNELPEIITSKGDSIKHVGIVFGSEESGLSNHDIGLCDMLSTVSMATRYPSLNLSQAVMVYAYERSVLSGKRNKKPRSKQNPESWKILKDRIEFILEQLDMREGDLIRNKLLDRLALIEEKDVYLLHSITSKILKKEQTS